MEWKGGRERNEGKECVVLREGGGEKAGAEEIMLCGCVRILGLQF